MNIFKNEKSFPKRYFARHIKEGVVRYVENGKDVLYLVTNEALKKMNPTFEGKPIYIRHVDKVDTDTMKMDKVGDVVKSFYNEFDGAWWAEIIVEDEGQKYIKKGWAVSNAYLPTELSSGGEYHNISYAKEIKNGNYDHLALVDNPRYEEAVIMSPDEYKAYNEGKKQELEQLKNSKENEMLSEEDKKALVDSLKAELAVMIKNAIAESAEEEKKNAEEEDHRKLIDEIAAIAGKSEDDFEGGLNEKIRTIIGIAEKLGYTKDEAKENEKPEEDKAENKCENGDDEESKENSDEESKEEESKDNSDDEESKENSEEEEKKDNSKEGFFQKLKNAKNNVSEKYIHTSAAALELGEERYGSK